LVKYGILNLNKPAGPTSRDCVNRVARALTMDKVAHAGTLDPLAKGVLVLLVGPAVRLMEEVHRYDKEYVGRFRLGQRSDSGDLETECLDVPMPPGIDREALQAAIAPFVGDIEQTPPAYSAVRVGGRRAHEVARRGKSVALPARRVSVHTIELLAFADSEFELRIACSTGTYIRSLGSDIAQRLGTDAVMTQLTRTRVGPFLLEQSIGIDAVESEPSNLQLLPATLGVLGLPHWRVDHALMRRILDGQRFAFEELTNLVVHPNSGSNSLPVACQRGAVLDRDGVLRALIKAMPDGTWRCEKGIAHWDVYP